MSEQNAEAPGRERMDPGALVFAVSWQKLFLHVGTVNQLLQHGHLDDQDLSLRFFDTTGGTVTPLRNEQELVVGFTPSADPAAEGQAGGTTGAVDALRSRIITIMQKVNEYAEEQLLAGEIDLVERQLARVPDETATLESLAADLAGRCNLQSEPVVESLAAALTPEPAAHPEPATSTGTRRLTPSPSIGDRLRGAVDRVALWIACIVCRIRWRHGRCPLHHPPEDNRSSYLHHAGWLHNALHAVGLGN